jgi:hypothetical protein
MDRSSHETPETFPSSASGSRPDVEFTFSQDCVSLMYFSGSPSPDAGRNSPDSGSLSPDVGSCSPECGRSPDAGSKSPDCGSLSRDCENALDQ